MATAFETNFKVHENHLFATLLDYFREPKNHAKYDEAAKIAYNQIARLNLKIADDVKNAFYFFASKLKNNITIESLCVFSYDCLKIVEKKGLFLSDNKNNNCEINIKKILHKSIVSSINQGLSEQSALNRAAFQLLKEKNAAEKLRRKNELAKNHPLWSSLQLMTASTKKIASEDIRNHLLALKKTPNTFKKGEGVLFGILQKAKAFSVDNLFRLLGEQLFFYAKPVGFLDKNEQIVLVEVTNESVMYTLTYQKMAILQALKKDNAFAKCKNIKFVIKSRF